VPSMKVAVYRFQVFDAATRAWRRAEGWGTVAYIDARNGATLFNTKRHVEAAEVSDEGFFAEQRAVQR